MIDDGGEAGDVAILYRMNAQSRPIEDALRRRRIPHVIYGGVRFYDRKEVKDALAYIRLVINPRSDVDFMRIVNVPPRGLGKTSIDRIEDVANEKGVSLLEAAGHAAMGSVKLTTKARKAVDDLLGLLTRTQTEALKEKPGRIVENILEDTGYLAMLRLEGTEESAQRLDNLSELVAAIDEFTETTEQGGGEATLATYLEEVALASDLDKLQDDDNHVALMTLHAAKGLEFPIVFLPGMEEGLFPHSRTLDDRAGLEEERRLCYVGITRAKHTLHLSAARVRNVFGEPRLSEISRFVDEVPTELISMAGTTQRAVAAFGLLSGALRRARLWRRNRQTIFHRRHKPGARAAHAAFCHCGFEIGDLARRFVGFALGGGACCGVRRVQTFQVFQHGFNRRVAFKSLTFFYVSIWNRKFIFILNNNFSVRAVCCFCF